jgi:medium-chain acyl-[acyl-carrier-protein] hydrolase
MEQNNIYSEQYPIHSYEIDPQYKATMGMLLKILQESAANHAYEHGLAVPHLMQKGFTWVLVKQLIRIFDFPVWKDTVTVETWSKGFRGFSAIRDYRVTGKGGKPLASGTSIWFIIDLEKRRPARLEQFQDSFFSLPNLNALEAVPGKIDTPKEFSIEKTLDIRKSDLDMNGHVNNINYADWVFESLPDDRTENYYLSEIEIHYLAETLYGDPIRVRTQFELDTAIHSILRTSDQAEVCRARTIWRVKG